MHARLSTTGWCVVQTPSWGLGAWRQGGANPYWGHDVEGHDVEGDLVRSPSPCHPPFSPSPGPGPFPLNCNRHSNRSLHLKVNFAVTPIGAFDWPFDLRLSTLTILNHNTINLRVVQKIGAKISTDFGRKSGNHYKHCVWNLHLKINNGGRNHRHYELRRSYENHNHCYHENLQTHQPC